MSRSTPRSCNLPASSRFGRTVRRKTKRQKSGAAIPQAFQDQPQIVSDTAQQHIHAVAFGALQMTESQPIVKLQMANDVDNGLLLSIEAHGCKAL